MGKPSPAPHQATTQAVPAVPGGEFVMLDGEMHYRISSYDSLAPFMMSIPSDSDLWMFITSGGGLTAGRVDADGSLFPYQTVDQLHDADAHTGPITLLRVEQDHAEPVLWEPFARQRGATDQMRRSIYKNAVGNRVVFEEYRTDLELVFRYSWAAADDFGWVRTARLENCGQMPRQVAVLDGLRNVLPFGAPMSLYQQASNLVDAYKTSEIDPETGLGIFSLTAGITDRAEAIEMLRANTVWCCGLEDFRVHLSLDAIEGFCEGRLVPAAAVSNGVRGNYLVSSHLDLPSGGHARWHLIGDTGLDQVQLARLRQLAQTGDLLTERVDAALRQATVNLRRNVASADGLQLSAEPARTTHHFANVLFNNMRGGVFADNYNLMVADFADFLQARNRAVALRQHNRLQKLPAQITIQELRALSRSSGDDDFERLSREYLPLHFGRRHGDPSRPWNHFSIQVRHESGEQILNYEGNWRDIFQNWEALCTAFPDFLPNVVAKFVNASTVDGFNPYRINRDGVDWETSDPNSEWSNIGYWGDHQIIYLLKLLEAWHDHDPDAVAQGLADGIYSYAAVPYRLKSYADILRDPSATITFDHAMAARVAERVAFLGTDGKLVTDTDDTVRHANLFEKLLVPALSKLSNLVPDGGIWMNTQRPEWNDANNALAGGGLSVVTMCHLRRYLAFMAEVLADSDATELPVATEIADWFEMIALGLEHAAELTAEPSLSPTDRKQLLDQLGQAFSAYRETVYTCGLTGQSMVPLRRVIRLCTAGITCIDWGLKANRRQDGLYHTYNTFRAASGGNTAEIGHLPEMLEGQVAVLTSGILQPTAALTVLERLFASRLFDPDRRSFVLYPARKLPGFLVRNMVPAADVLAIPLLAALLETGESSLIRRDADDVHRFSADLQNASHLKVTLDRLAGNRTWHKAVARDRQAVLTLYEQVFQHKSYTGRSGAMYGYEGLGCIYWHMVAKLLLAVQENVSRAAEDGSTAQVRNGLARMYYRVRAGIGYEKSVSEYGAFPTDPYSHTPARGGAKQPGMTGQVKEEILTRRAEVGISVRAGRISFAPSLLQRGEFLHQPGEFFYFDIRGEAHTLAAEPGSFCFTLCQVPVIYELTDDGPWHSVSYSTGTPERVAGHELSVELSSAVFSRSDRIELIRVGVVPSELNSQLNSELNQVQA